MGVKHLIKRCRRFLNWFFTFVLCCTILFIAAKIGIEVWVEKSHVDIKKILTKQLGMPVELSSIETTWDDLSFGITLKQIIIYDPAVPVPFMSIQKAKLAINFLHYLFNQSVQFKKISLEDPKLVIGRDGIYSLKGEPLPSTIDVQALLAQLKSVEVIKIKNGEIRWLTSAGGSDIKQVFSGELYWLDSTVNDFGFEGKHSLQVGESLSLPETSLIFTWQPSKNDSLLKTGNKFFKLECESRGQDWVDSKCDLSFNNIDLHLLADYFVLKESDPAWAKWLVGALKRGKITEGRLQLADLMHDWQWTGELDAENVELKYGEEWPAINKIQGKVKFDNRDLRILALKSEILETPTEEVLVIIPEIGRAQDLHVLVDGSLEGRLEQGLEFLKLSPLNARIAKKLEAFNPMGPMKLKLKLDIPVGSDKLTTKVNGVILLSESTVTLPKWDTSLTALDGNLNFTEEGLESENLKGILFDHDLNIFLKTQSFDKNIQLNVSIKDLVEAKGIIAYEGDVLKKNQWTFEGNQLNGSLVLLEASKNAFTIDLKFLKLSAEKGKQEAAIIEFLETNKPMISFHCKDFQKGETSFGEVRFRLNPQSYGYEIQNLIANARTFQFSANGKWQWDEEQSFTSLEGQLLSNNMSHTLKQLGYPSAMREAKGKIQFNLTWPQSLFQFGFADAEGEARVSLRSGRILGVDPGLGRIIGLLSIKNIGSMFKKGFVFDTLRTTLIFDHGVLKTDALSMDGPTAKIELTGNATIKSKEVDLKMTVTPKMVGTGLPLAAALAGGPAVGVGVWVFDQFMGSKLGEIPVTRHNYRVTGTWDSPIVKEMGL